MRDLKRANSNTPAYRQLAEQGFEVFTPLHRVVRTVGGRRQWREQPVVGDLLFVNSTRAELDPVVESTPTLQYRFMRGRPAGEPMTVRDEEMERFIQAVSAQGANPRFYAPGEITPDMMGRTVRIIGGLLDNVEARMLSIRGTRRRRILISIPDLITASVEVSPDLIEIID